MKKQFLYLWNRRGLYILLGLLVLGIFVAPLLISEGILSDLEGVVGQLYLVILIATLVSEFSAKAKDEC